MQKDPVRATQKCQSITKDFRLAICLHPSTFRASDFLTRSWISLWRQVNLAVSFLACQSVLAEMAQMQQPLRDQGGTDHRSTRWRLHSSLIGDSTHRGAGQVPPAVVFSSILEYDAPLRTRARRREHDSLFRVGESKAVREEWITLRVTDVDWNLFHRPGP